MTDATSLTAALRRGPNPLRGEAPVQRSANPLRILFLVSAHNSLSQRAQIALTELGHTVDVEVVETGEAMEIAVERHRPELIVCPILKKIIPESIFAHHRCLIVHPGPVGDRGPSSLDWSIELGMGEWGVTVLEASAEVDGGDIWGTSNFRTRETGKSSIYRHEVRRAAIASLLDAMAALERGDTPRRLDYGDAKVVGRPRPLIRQPERAIDWSADSTETVVRRIRAAEGHPGVLDTIEGQEFHLFGVHRERGLRGLPGEIIATRHGGICRATVDGAVWITHLKRPDHFKLPAVRALELAGITLDAPEIDVPVHAPIPEGHTWREIAYTEHAGVGYLEFDFYNGAMSTAQCRRLLEAYRYARSRRTTKVIVLCGGSDFFSNGIHLNVIEAAQDPATESWHNLHAIDDVVREIVETDSHLVISALQGDAAAGGVPFAMAADHVVARDGRRAEPLLPAHGRPLRLRVLHVPDAAPHRPRADRRADLGAVPGHRHPPRRGDRHARRGLRRRRRELPRPGQRARRAARGERRPRALAGGEAPPPRRRRADQAAQRLPHRGARALARVLLRGRPQLPRGPQPLRPQDGRPVQGLGPAADNQAMELLRSAVSQVAA